MTGSIYEAKPGRFNEQQQHGVRRQQMYAALHPTRVGSDGCIQPDAEASFSTHLLIGTSVSVVGDEVALLDATNALTVGVWTSKGQVEVRDTDGGPCPDVEVVEYFMKGAREVVVKLRNVGSEPVTVNPVLFFGE